MKNLLKTTCAALALGTVASAEAAPAPTTAVPPTALIASVPAAEVEGTIRSIAEDEASFVVTLADGSTVKITVKDDTVYTLDGKKSTRSAALKAGRTVKVTHDERTASRVEVTSG